jgi:molybdate transport system substrate-binding protein
VFAQLDAMGAALYPLKHNESVFMRNWVCLLSICALFLSAASVQAETVKVFAAASMKTALDQIAAAWKERTGDSVVATYGSSAVLARQIEHGAPANIYISADLEWMDVLAKKQLIAPESRISIAGNTLVLIAASDDKRDTDIANLVGSLGVEKLALADVRSVPAGKYAKAALDHLGLWASVEPQVVMQDNVRSALNLVARGEAPLGIVYGSDAVSETRVQVLATFPEHSHPKIVYPAAMVAGADDEPARTFLAFLQQSEAKNILLANGFTSPE